MFQNLIELGRLAPGMNAGTNLIAIAFLVVAFVAALPFVGNWWANHQFAWLKEAADEDVEDVVEEVTEDQIVASWKIDAEQEVPEEIRRAA